MTDINREMISPLPSAFYGRDTLAVARDLLGCVLYVPGPQLGTLIGGTIVEVEAYTGDDPASHAARGITRRCAPMFAAGGIAYVYFIYGMYSMFNVVTGRDGTPGAVLVRAIVPQFGRDIMATRRSAGDLGSWTNGPGRLTRALAIDQSFNSEPLSGSRIGIAHGTRPKRIAISSRVGISAGQDRMWRFFDPDSEWVSRVKENKSSRYLT